MIIQTSEQHVTRKRLYEHNTNIMWQDIENVKLSDVKDVIFSGCKNKKKMIEIISKYISKCENIQVIDLRSSCMDDEIARVLFDITINGTKLVDKVVYFAFDNKEEYLQYLTDKHINNHFKVKELMDLNIEYYKDIKFSIVDIEFDVNDQLFNEMIRKLNKNNVDYRNIENIVLPKYTPDVLNMLKVNKLIKACNGILMEPVSLEKLFKMSKDDLYIVNTINVDGSSKESIDKFISEYLPYCENLEFLFFQPCELTVNHIKQMEPFMSKIKNIQIYSYDEEICNFINEKSIFKNINGLIDLSMTHVYECLNSESRMSVTSDNNIIMDKFVEILNKRKIRVKSINFNVDCRVPSNIPAQQLENMYIKRMDIDREVILDYINAGGKVTWDEQMVIYVYNGCRLPIYNGEIVFLHISCDMKFFIEFILANNINIGSICFSSSLTTIEDLKDARLALGERQFTTVSRIIVGENCKVKTDIIEILSMIFPNVKTLLVSRCSSFNVQSFSQLQYIRYMVVDNWPQAITRMPPSIEFADIILRNNQMADINIPLFVPLLLDKLKNITITARNIRLIIDMLPRGLEKFIINEMNHIDLHHSFTFNGFTNLKYIKLVYMNIKSINLNGLVSLEMLKIHKCIEGIYSLSIVCDDEFHLQKLYLLGMTRKFSLFNCRKVCVNDLYIEDCLLGNLFDNTLRVNNIFVKNCETKGLNLLCVSESVEILNVKTLHTLILNNQIKRLSLLSNSLSICVINNTNVIDLKLKLLNIGLLTNLNELEINEDIGVLTNKNQRFKIVRWVNQSMVFSITNISGDVVEENNIFNDLLLDENSVFDDLSEIFANIGVVRDLYLQNMKIISSLDMYYIFNNNILLRLYINDVEVDVRRFGYVNNCYVFKGLNSLKVLEMKNVKFHTDTNSSRGGRPVNVKFPVSLDKIKVTNVDCYFCLDESHCEFIISSDRFHDDVYINNSQIKILFESVDNLYLTLNNSYVDARGKVNVFSKILLTNSNVLIHDCGTHAINRLEIKNSTLEGEKVKWVVNSLSVSITNITQLFSLLNIDFKRLKHISFADMQNFDLLSKLFDLLLENSKISRRSINGIANNMFNNQRITINSLSFSGLNVSGEQLKNRLFCVNRLYLDNSILIPNILVTRYINLVGLQLYSLEKLTCVLGPLCSVSISIGKEVKNINFRSVHKLVCKNLSINFLYDDINSGENFFPNLEYIRRSTTDIKVDFLTSFDMMRILPTCPNTLKVFACNLKTRFMNAASRVQRFTSDIESPYDVV